ncbi:tyrosine-protein kinase BAZ1B-like isoform X2 [Macrobrachium rosenbergii]|uniref:tyrosine-protein kinase BAZ1B-like isoform X2 n=2 Tax=Macrobrachium rosenbergii TaxID=79674 RepID=UPI0034D5546D
MPLLQGQPFRLIKPPETVPSGTELYIIQHTGEKFISKSDYEDRLALYSQSIWTCQCSGKSGLTHQEAWTSESKVRVMLSSSFPAPLWSPILHCIHHSTQPLDQLVETTAALCLSKFHVGEELTYLNPPTQVRVVSSREAPVLLEVNDSNPEKPRDSSPEKPKAMDSQSSSPVSTPLTNGCTNSSRDGASLNGTSNGSASTEEGSPSGSIKAKDDSPAKKKGMLPLLYDVLVIGEDRKIKDVPAKDLQRTYKIPPKEHFRLFIRANALRQRASAFTPWIVSEDLVKQYNIPSKLASVFTQPSFNFSSKKRKLDHPVEKVKKQKSEDNKKSKPEKEKIKKEPKDPNAPKKKPGPKPGFKRTPKAEVNAVVPVPVKSETPVKMETSDSDDDISLAALASKSPKFEANSTKLEKTPEKVNLPKPLKREPEKNTQPNKKMKQATLFDLKSSKTPVTSGGTPGSPKKSPQKRVITPETVMRMPVMRRLLHQRKMYKGVRGMGRKIVYIMDQALNKLSLKHIAAIPDQELQEELMKRREKSLEEKKKKQATKFVLSLRIQELNRKLEDKILKDIKPLPPPKLVPTPEDIPNSLFGDITMIVEFIECYRDIVLTDKKKSISSQHLMQALSAGKNGFKYISEIMVLLLHIIIDDERIGDNKELGVKISELAVHYQTAMELARLCLNKGGSDIVSQHSEDNEFEEECELSEGLLKKLDTHELYELQAEEIIEVLRALCHRAMASYTCLEYFEDIEEKTAVLHKQYLKIKKEHNKQELMKKKERREALLKKRREKKNSPSKAGGRPKKPSTVNTLENFIKKEPAKEEAKDEEECPDIISVVKRKRMTAEELLKEKEEQSKELREQRLKEEEELKKQQIVLAWEKINLQRETIARLQPLGVDRNHDRYWLFNCTTPGLYVEKGWVDANTTYCVKNTSPRKDSSASAQLEAGKSSDKVSPSVKSSLEKHPKAAAHKPNLASAEKDASLLAPMSGTPVTNGMPLKQSNINGTGVVMSQSSPAADSATVNSSSVTHGGSNAAVVSSSVTSVSGTLLQPSQDNSGNITVSPASDSKPFVHGSGSENGVTSVVPGSKPGKGDTSLVLCSASKSSSTSLKPKSGIDSSVMASVQMSESDCRVPNVMLGSRSPSDGPLAPQSNMASAVTSDNQKSEKSSKCDQTETVSGLISVSPVGSILSQQMSSQKTLASVILPECDSDSDEKPLAAVKKQLELEAEDRPLSDVKRQLELEAEDRPLSDVKRQLELEAEDKPLSLIKKELSESPSKVRPRGRPPKPKVDTPPRPRGRPPKEKLSGEEKIQRPRGRPPKSKTLDDGTPVVAGEGSPGKRGRPKALRFISDDETFPPVGQNMWFYYNSLEEIDALLESLAVKGLRESKLKAAIMQARKQMELNFVKEWQPLEELVDGSVQLLETLREDIIQIEKELNEGWLGSVPELEAWEKKANEAGSVQELGECLIEAQRHIQIKFLKGIMKPIRKPIPTENPEAPQDYEEVEGSAVQQWRDAVSSCSTLSRLHLLVGMFDSCIKWEKSMATKKCKVCRAQDTSVPLAICDRCEGSYHWRCLRPQLNEEPPEPWLCPGCQPSKNKERRKITRNQVEEEREEHMSTEFKQEKICRVCERGIGLIFCSNCPAAYHSECHDPPLQTRARKDWKCVDCQKPRSRSSRAATSARQEVSKVKELPKKETKTKAVVSKETASRRSSSRRSKYTEVEDDYEEEEEDPAPEESSENDDSQDEDFTTRRKSTRIRKTVNPPRRTTSRCIKKKSYKIESEEEEEEEEEEDLAEEEEEEEEQEGSEDEQEEEEEQGSEDDQEEEDEEEHNEDDDDKEEEEEERDDDEEEKEVDEDEEEKEVDEDDEDEDSEIEIDEDDDNQDEKEEEGDAED